jgi:hypothetical protein
LKWQFWFNAENFAKNSERNFSRYLQPYFLGQQNCAKMYHVVEEKKTRN